MFHGGKAHKLRMEIAACSALAVQEADLLQERHKAYSPPSHGLIPLCGRCLKPLPSGAETCGQQLCSKLPLVAGGSHAYPPFPTGLCAIQHMLLSSLGWTCCLHRRKQRMRTRKVGTGVLSLHPGGLHSLYHRIEVLLVDNSLPEDERTLSG